MSKYSLIQVEDLPEWDRLVDKSPQGTIFSSSQYLQATGPRYSAHSQIGHIINNLDKWKLDFALTILVHIKVVFLSSFV